MRRTFIIIFLGILFLALRVEHSVLFYDLGRDKRYQMTAAANLVAGKGISHCKVFAEDISKVYCDELTWWSAGYPVVVGGLYKITGDLTAADFTLIVFGLVVFLVASMRFFSLWTDEESHWWPLGGFLIFAGFSFTPFNYFSTNDLLSTAFLLLAIAEASIGQKKVRSSSFVLAGFAAFIAAFFKFSFYPLLAAIPASLIILAAIRRDPRPIQHLIYFLLPIAAGFLVLMAAFPNHVLPPGGEWTQGWNWENLLSQDPFGVRALYFIDFLIRRLDVRSEGGWLATAFIHLVSFSLLGAFVFSAVQYVRTSFREKDREGRVLCALAGTFVLATLSFYLMWLAVRVPTFYHPIYEAWTFVQETRYYGPAMVLLTYAAFLVPAHLGRRSSMARTASLVLAASVCLYAVTYWSYKNFDYFYNGRVEGSFASGPGDDAVVAEYLRNERTLDRSTTVLGFISHAGAYGYPILLTRTDPSTYPFPWFDWYVGAEPVSTSRPRTLLVLIHKSPTPADAGILESYPNIRLLELSSYDLYRLEIAP